MYLWNMKTRFIHFFDYQNEFDIQEI